LFQEAILGLKKCLKLGDDGLDVWLGYTDILLFLGKNKEAFLLINKAEKLHKNSVELAYRLACLEFVFKNEKSALSLLEKALKENFEHHKEVRLLFPAIFQLELVQALLRSLEK